MTFKDILVIYENKIDNAKARLDRGLIEQEEYDIIIRESLYWLTQLKFFMKDEEWFSIRKPTADDINKWGDPVEIMEYRNDVIPIFNDDYGQCLYAKICGKEYGGGTYNFFPYIDFANIYDSEILTYYK